MRTPRDIAITGLRFAAGTTRARRLTQFHESLGTPTITGSILSPKRPPEPLTALLTLMQ
jgi:hypothetical protein